MAVLETKYSIGDTVYFATTVSARKMRDCPDCKGERKWKAVSPAGHEYTFPCPRCAAAYTSEHRLSLQYSAFEPYVQKLTVGQVRAVSPVEDGRRAEYMCVETGVGSGSLYDEARLFATEEEAKIAAAAMAASQNQTVPWCVEQFNATLEVCDYQLDDGRQHIEANDLRRFQWVIRDLLDDLRDADTLESVKTRIEEYDNA